MYASHAIRVRWPNTGQTLSIFSHASLACDSFSGARKKKGWWRHPIVAFLSNGCVRSTVYTLYTAVSATAAAVGLFYIVFISILPPLPRPLFFYVYPCRMGKRKTIYVTRVFRNKFICIIVSARLFV